MVAPPYEIDQEIFVQQLRRLMDTAVQQPTEVEPLIYALTGIVKERESSADDLRKAIG